MSIRLRESKSLGMGVRLTASKAGLGRMAGFRGIRYRVHRPDRRTRWIGIPGSGLRDVKTTTGGSAGKAEADARRPTAPAGVDAASLLPRPGFFASRLEKRYHEGVRALIRGDAEHALLSFGTVLAHEPEVPSPHLLSALAVGRTGGPEATQIGHLERSLKAGWSFPIDFRRGTCLQGSVTWG